MGQQFQVRQHPPSQHPAQHITVFACMHAGYDGCVNAGRARLLVLVPAADLWAEPSPPPTPTACCCCVQDPDFPSLSGARVVRIAVHPQLSGAGYGSRALEQLKRFFQVRHTRPLPDTTHHTLGMKYTCAVAHTWVPAGWNTLLTRGSSTSPLMPMFSQTLPSAVVLKRTLLCTIQCAGSAAEAG